MSDLYEERDKDRLRDRLRKSEARFRNVIARSVDAILVLDMRGTVLFANPVAEKLFCKSASDLVGQYFGYPVVGGAKTELDIRHGPDSFYVGEMRVVETEWEDEPALLATIRDVTERKQMEEALAASEARLRVVFESSLDAMLVLDDNAVYVDANPAACDMFKLDRVNCLGHSLADFMADPTGFKQLWRAITRAGRKRGEIKLRLPDGSNSEVEYSAVRNILPERHLISLRDITRRKRAEAMNEALNRITTGIAGTFDFDEIFRRSMEDATKALDCESATVLLRESDEWIVRHVHGLAGIPVGLRFSSREAIIQAIAERTRAPVVVNDAAEDERVNPDSLRHFGFKSFIAIPLTIRGDVIGTLSFHRISRRSDFTKAQVEFARSLAAALSLALENARVYQAERTIADTLQRALLVMPEHVEGIDYGHLYQSASEAAMVGGDFYDIFELEHGKVGLLIGDVAGKGLEAATLTSLVKHAVGAYALEGHTPSAITSKVNNMILASNLVGATFVTAFVGVLDTISGELMYCDAGHLPGLLRKHGGGGVAALETGSPILGALPNLPYYDGLERIDFGDVLLLYTDGVTDAKRGRERYGEERLLRIFQELSPTPASDVPRLIFNDILSFSGGQLVDDTAMLAISLSQTKSQVPTQH